MSLRDDKNVTTLTILDIFSFKAFKLLREVKKKAS